MHHINHSERKINKEGGGYGTISLHLVQMVKLAISLHSVIVHSLSVTHQCRNLYNITSHSLLLMAFLQKDERLFACFLYMCT